MKDGSLLIFSLASFNYFTYIRNHLQMAQPICQKWLYGTGLFVKGLKMLCSLDHSILFKFRQLNYGKIFTENYKYYFRPQILATASYETMEELERKI